MTEQNESVKWLPAGWTVDVRRKGNGTKYKIYVDPSNEHRFFSKLQVLRYLNNEKVSPCGSNEKNKCTGEHSAENFVVEKSAAEGLPPGWIKETRIIRKGRNIKSYSYYIDPVRGYLFCSMKEVCRYLEKEELGRLACASKDKGCIKVETEDDKLITSAGAEGQELTDNATDRQDTRDQRSNLGVLAKDEETFEPNCTEDCKLLFEGKDDSSKSMSISASIVGILPEKQPLENRMAKHGKIQYMCKKVPDLSRRSSKRLAGIEVSLLELETNTRARQVVARQSGVAKGNATMNLATQEKDAGKVKTENTVDENPESLHLPSGDLWTDPCIKFAVKTLTGEIPVGDDP